MGSNLMRYWCVSEVYDVRAALEEVGGRAAARVLKDNTAALQRELDAMRAAFRVMDECVAERLSIRVMSASVNLSPKRFAQLFKEEMGISPKEYLGNLRMERARDLLLNSFLTVKQVTFESGFPDVSHFVRNFKNRHGVTPSQFRRNPGRHK